MREYEILIKVKVVDIEGTTGSEILLKRAVAAAGQVAAAMATVMEDERPGIIGGYRQPQIAATVAYCQLEGKAPDER